jgi:dGTPase
MARLYRENDARRVAPTAAAHDKLEKYRTAWRRDYARLIHSAAFRRLQGKTQLFPCHESDFFRNRLTHSLEVAQVAKSIAIRLNDLDPLFKKDPINTDLVETAALAHDLGHPPFGHNGEMILDHCMRNSGGFEGNAQTLRILCKLEKRQTTVSQGGEPLPVHNGKDTRAGLNLTFRTLAAILKYDHEIPLKHKDRTNRKPGKVTKGYYHTEADLVKQIKRNVGAARGKEFRTIECSIMDLADDIAYSTYDLEDAFKARFLTPLSMLAADDRILDDIAATVSQRLREHYPWLQPEEQSFSARDATRILLDVFSDKGAPYGNVFTAVTAGQLSQPIAANLIAAYVQAASDKTARQGYYRTKLTSELVGSFVRAVNVRVDKANPALSRAYLDVDVFKRVEVLKNFAFESLIMSPMLKVAEYRGKDIVKRIFLALIDDGSHRLMPEDFQSLYEELASKHERRRVVCDFIAGMTDRYAIQFYGRLFGTTPETIYSPL